MRFVDEQGRAKRSKVFRFFSRASMVCIEVTNTVAFGSWKMPNSDQSCVMALADSGLAVAAERGLEEHGAVAAE